MLAFAPVDRTRVQDPAGPVFRSNTKPVSLFDMSDQDRVTLVADVALTARLVGGSGMEAESDAVVTPASFE